MAYYTIQGQKKLSGTFTVTGAKNAALKFIAAALLCDGPVTLTNVPEIDDVHRMLALLVSLGAVVQHNHEARTVVIDARPVSNTTVSAEHSQKIRTSVMVVGPLLVRFGKAVFGYPGGDVIGRRPIDLFIRGYEKFGARVTDVDDAYVYEASALHGMTMVFPIVSHVATETLMLTATRVAGITVIKNAALEPEVVALAEFLNACGAKISGAGTPTITIEGVTSLTGGTAAIMPDRIEAGTMVLLGVLTKSALRVERCNPGHLENLLAHLELLGAPFSTGPDWIETTPYNHELVSVNVKTHEYPGFVTDLQAPFAVLLTQTRGQSLVHETLFEGRLFYTDLLNRMGANIILCDPHRAIIHGPTPLRGRKLESPDIRAGIAMVMAGLIAKGETVIGNIEQIDRGYEHIDDRLRALGADIIRSAA